MTLTRASAKTIWSKGQRPTSANYADLFDALTFGGSPITPGEIIAGALTTASAHTVQGGGAVGISVFESATTASARNHLGISSAAAVGQAIFDAVTTASAWSNLGFAAATTAQTSSPTNTSSTFLTPGVLHYHPLMIKAWVNFKNSETVSIRQSYNVASIADTGTGQTRINWGSAFPTTYYGLAGMHEKAINAKGGFVAVHSSAGSKAAGECIIMCVSAGDTGSALKDTSSLSVWAISR